MSENDSQNRKSIVPVVIVVFLVQLLFLVIGVFLFGNHHGALALLLLPVSCILYNRYLARAARALGWWLREVPASGETIPGMTGMVLGFLGWGLLVIVIVIWILLFWVSPTMFPPPPK